jgi:hypothetical protein
MTQIVSYGSDPSLYPLHYFKSILDPFISSDILYIVFASYMPFMNHIIICIFLFSGWVYCFQLCLLL